MAGEFNGGVVAVDVVTASFIIPAGITNDKYDLELGDALTTGTVHVRKNGGGFSNVITAGNTTGTTTATFSTGDTLAIRHTGSTNDVNETLLRAANEFAIGIGKYAILTF